MIPTRLSIVLVLLISTPTISGAGETGGAQVERTFTPEERERLRVWIRGSHYSEEVVQRAIDDPSTAPEWYELLVEELSLEPISPEAWEIRKRQGLEPPDLDYMEQVDACIASIGAGRRVSVDRTQVTVKLRAQRQTVEDYRLALSGWLAGWSKGRVIARDGLSDGIVNEVYETLGDPDEEKRAIAAMVVPRLDRVERSLNRPNAIRDRVGTWFPEHPKTLEEKLFHSVTQLDLGTWFTVPNIRTMVRNIGAKDKVVDLTCWLGNPDDIPGLRRRVEAIGDWVSGRPADAENTDVAEVLGERDAYKEKVWLARCLLVPLRNHASDERVAALQERRGEARNEGRW